MSKSNWDKGFTSGAKAARKASANSVCTICCDGCKEHGERVERDRIIKLLESDPENIIASGGGLRAGYETAITLIKGEK